MLVYSTENTWKEIRDSGVDIAVLAVGSIEQHGHHLPLATDWYQADAHARGLAEKLGAFLVPTMPYGTAWEHGRFPGTISLRPETLAAVVRDIIMCLREHGFTKIVVHNGHGANWILKPTVRQLNYDYPDLSIVWSGGVNPEEGDQPPGEIHSGRSETSRMLHLRPDLVKNTGVVDSPGVVGQEFLDYVGFDKVTRTGAWGYPTQGSAEEGRQIVEDRIEASARYVRWALAKVAELKAAPGVVKQDQVTE
jgi:creatinine amidohydrolase